MPQQRRPRRRRRAHTRTCLQLHRRMNVLEVRDLAEAVRAVDQTIVLVALARGGGRRRILGSRAIDVEARRLGQEHLGEPIRAEPRRLLGRRPCADELECLVEHKARRAADVIEDLWACEACGERRACAHARARRANVLVCSRARRIADAIVRLVHEEATVGSTGCGERLNTRRDVSPWRPRKTSASGVTRSDAHESRIGRGSLSAGGTSGRSFAPTAPFMYSCIHGGCSRGGLRLASLPPPPLAAGAALLRERPPPAPAPALAHAPPHDLERAASEE